MKEKKKSEPQKFPFLSSLIIPTPKSTPSYIHNSHAYYFDKIAHLILEGQIESFSLLVRWYHNSWTEWKESHVQHEENGFVHGSLSEITFFDGMTCLSIEDLPCYPRCTIKKICTEIGFLIHPFWIFYDARSLPFIIIIHWLLKMMPGPVDNS